MGQTIVTGLAVAAMARLEREIWRGVIRAGMVHVAQPPRVIEFRVPEWHIVGAE